MPSRSPTGTISAVARDWLWALGCVAVGAAVAGAGFAAYDALLPSDRALPGLRIGGRIQPRDTALGDWLEARRVALQDREAYLRLPDDTERLRFADLGLELDVSKTLQRVLDVSAPESFTTRLYHALRARRSALEVSLVFRLDERRARATIERFASRVRREPVDARLDLGGHQRVAERLGRELDLPGTLAAIAEGERDEDAFFELRTRSVRPAVTLEMLAQIDVSQVLSGFESDFAGTGAGRARNIATAARYLDGTVIAPGRVLSFNQVVGPREIGRGFTWAPVIVDDELEPGVGGGVCQVASTLHAAAVYGLLELTERRSHSRPSGYVPLGLDATVVDGEVDLKLRNPYPAPLILHAFLPAPTRLRIELLGQPSPGRVEHSYAVMKTHEFYRRVTTKPWFPSDRQVRRQRGKKGYDILSIVSVFRGDGPEVVRRYQSHYQPVPEVFWVGPGGALSELPELPEGAEHVEIDGVRDEGLTANPSAAAPGG